MPEAVLGIAAPARTCVKGEGWGEVDHARIDAAEEGLRRRGWRVVEAANVRSLERRFAGTDRERAEGLESLFADPEVDLIMTIRGGYGTARILPLLDWELVGRSHARFMGLSDATAFTCALYARTGRASWQGPVASWFAEENPARDEAFEKALTGPSFSAETGSAPCGCPGPVEGVLWGGNLSILVSLLGTEWFPCIEGGILVVEDTGEPAWRIERMLDQLANAGVLGSQRALVFGCMTGAGRGEGSGKGRFSIADAAAYIREKTGVPVYGGLHFGHVPDTLTLPFGVEAVLEEAGDAMRLTVEKPPLPALVPWLDGPRSRPWWQ